MAMLKATIEDEEYIDRTLEQQQAGEALKVED